MTNNLKYPIITNGVSTAVVSAVCALKTLTIIALTTADGSSQYGISVYFGIPKRGFLYNAKEANPIVVYTHPERLSSTFEMEFQNMNRKGITLILVVALFAFVAQGIAEAAENKIYWVDGVKHKILRANLDGSKVEDVFTGLSYPTSIALDVSSSCSMLSLR